MGESRKPPLRVESNRQIQLTFHGATLTGDVWGLAHRKPDENLHLTSTASAQIHDTPTRRNTRFSLQVLLRQSVYSRRTGFEGVNDAQRILQEEASQGINFSEVDFPVDGKPVGHIGPESQGRRTLQPGYGMCSPVGRGQDSVTNRRQ